MSDPAPQVLAPLVLGVGAARGFAGTDLTGAPTAVAAGEVPLRRPGAARSVLELRVHGVGGAPPAENLQSPATVQVAGDGVAGFHRAWFPGGSAPGQPLREAYCWGGLNTRATSRALYLVLIPFMLVNLAHWALPAPPEPAGPTPPTRARARRHDTPANAVARALLRLLGLALTLAFVGTTVTLLGDLLAWQAAGMNRGGLPGWAGAYTDRTSGTRLALALLATFAVLALLVWLSLTSLRRYERWESARDTDEDPTWPLTKPSFWRGERVVSRQLHLHAMAASALILMFAALPSSPTPWPRGLLLSTAAVVGLGAALALASPWCDHTRVAGQPRTPGDAACAWYARVVVGFCVLGVASRFWWSIEDDSRALPGDQATPAAIVYTAIALVVALFVVVAAQQPWLRGQDVTGWGLAAPLIAGLAVVVATIFGASLTLAAANIKGSPRTRGEITDTEYLLPQTVYAGGFGMMVALVMAVLVGAWLGAWAWGRRSQWIRLDANRPRDSVQSSYPEPGESCSVKHVAGIWARSALTDHAATVIALLALPTAVATTAYLVRLELGGDRRFFADVATVGGTVGALATVAFLGILRSALLDGTRRKRFGVLWDVCTFWPRACQPFAPPCYAERSVPEVVTRIRRLVGDQARGDGDPALAQQDAEARGGGGVSEAPGPVLLTGYSQGSPIAVAVLAQLPQSVRAQMSLLTMGAPIRRLYGRTFPAYFGPRHLEQLANHLRTGRDARWRNLVRRSDYIGGWALADPVRYGTEGRLVDRLLQDPPVLWKDAAHPSRPPTHRHSDFFPDPQVQPHVEELTRYHLMANRPREPHLHDAELR